MNPLASAFGALCGAIVGSLLTSMLSNYAASRREIRQNRLKVLTALMSGRSDILAEVVAENVNVIPMLFYDETMVRRAYRRFCAFPNGPPADLYRRYNEMVLAIAASLHLEDLSPADIDLGYYPLPHAPQARMADVASPSASRTPEEP